MTAPTTLQVDNLHLDIRGTPILRGVSLSVPQGRVHGLVGESGGGKTMVGKAILGVLPGGARITEGAVRFGGRDLNAMPDRERRSLLGASISMILQDPLTALNPVLRIQTQMVDVLRQHLGLAAREARARAIEMLDAVHIREPERVLKLYPHELSGGMRQRVIISIAFSCDPELVIADEPTTALDVTVQRQILRLIKEMQERTGASVLFITHDLGVVAKICDHVSVIFAGRILESAPAADVFAAPQHPYTRALFAATPRYDQPANVLKPVPTTLTDQLWEDAHAYDASRGHA